MADLLCEVAIESYRSSIDMWEKHIDGEEVGFLETRPIDNTVSGLFPISKKDAIETLVRELRRYADFMEWMAQDRL